ncbi:MAG: ATP-binding protein [Rikenellaceae bacterium]
MATDFMSRIAQQGRIFTVVLVLLWVLVIGFAGFRYWLFMDEDFLTASPEHLMLFDDMFFIVSGIITILISVVGFTVARLYNSLGETMMRVEHEHEEALKHEQEKIRIKRQLTNNINHELKTPICSILGYLEMILGNEKLDKKTVRIFVEKSYDQAERLRRLMADLATITRIDEAASMVEREDVEVSSLVSDVIDDTMPQAEEKGIVVESRIAKEIHINGNQMLLYSIFRNLVDNAVAYSGGRLVLIDLIKEDNDLYYFRVQDNGIGVEEEHLPYLFERFYRVDKGRSRKAGGTGLGLSIVKNAVVFHGGTIIARTSPSRGLEFEFSLKKMIS